MKRAQHGVKYTSAPKPNKRQPHPWSPREQRVLHGLRVAHGSSFPCGAGGGVGGKPQTTMLNSKQVQPHAEIMNLKQI